MTKLVFSHCPACAENDEGADDYDAGVGCSAYGPTDGCEAVWVEERASADPITPLGRQALTNKSEE